MLPKLEARFPPRRWTRPGRPTGEARAVKPRGVVFICPLAREKAGGSSPLFRSSPIRPPIGRLHGPLPPRAGHTDCLRPLALCSASTPITLERGHRPHLCRPGRRPHPGHGQGEEGALYAHWHCLPGGPGDLPAVTGAVGGLGGRASPSGPSPSRHPQVEKQQGRRQPLQEPFFLLLFPAPPAGRGHIASFTQQRPGPLHSPASSGNPLLRKRPGV